MRIALLTNHQLGIPVIEYLILQGVAVGLGIPALNHDATEKVRALAAKHDIPLATIRKKTMVVHMQRWLQQVNADAVFVLTFPYKIPPNVLSVPRFGFFNVHFGKLPGYRGADPVFWQIRNGEQTGGITIHNMDEGLDTGPIVYAEGIPIAPTDTYGVFVAKLSFSAMKTVGTVIQALMQNPLGVPRYKQDEACAAYQRRPTEDDMRIDWANSSAQSITALVRACNPGYGGALTYFKEMEVRALQASIISGIVDFLGTQDGTVGSRVPGEVLEVDAESGITVYCAKGGGVRLEVLYIEHGIYSAGRLAEVLNIRVGDTFSVELRIPAQVGSVPS